MQRRPLTRSLHWFTNPIMTLGLRLLKAQGPHCVVVGSIRTARIPRPDRWRKLPRTLHETYIEPEEAPKWHPAVMS